MIGTPWREPDRGWAAFDPRARILALVFFVAAASCAASPALPAGMCLSAFLALAPSGLTLRDAAKRLVPVNVFMLLLWLTLPFFEGEAGMWQAALVTLKGNAIVAATNALLHPVENGMLAVALRRLGCPAKLVWLLVLSHRSVTGMADRAAKSVTAIRMRSVTPSGAGSGVAGFRRRLGAYGGLFAKLFVGGHERGGRLHAAMRSRGYGEAFTLRRGVGPWRARDILLTGATGALLAFSLGGA